MLDESMLGSYKIGQCSEVTIGEGATILAEHFDKVVTSMKEHETSYVKSKLDCHGKKVDELSSKEKGLRFKMTLLEMNRAAESDDLEQDERIERAQHYKDAGTDLFREGNVAFAIKRYQRSLDYLSDIDKHGDIPPDVHSQQMTLHGQCHFNLAACYLKEEKYEEVVHHCTEGLAIDADNIKGLFRRGQAYVKLCQYEDAKKDLSKGMQLDPTNKAMANQFAILNGLIRKEKQMYQRMF